MRRCRLIHLKTARFATYRDLIVERRDSSDPLAQFKDQRRAGGRGGGEQFA
jgi:hypothetical protein